MEKVEIRGALEKYLRLPLYSIIPIWAACIGLGFYDKKVIMPVACVAIIYAIIMVVAYSSLRKRCITALLDMATEIKTSQKDFLSHMQTPYAVVDIKGCIMWQNESFHRLTGAKQEGVVPISSIIQEITEDFLKNIGEEAKEIICQLDKYHLKVFINKMNKSGNTEELSLFSVVVLDETEKVSLRSMLDTEKIVVASVTVDNYDEILEELEDVKRSLLAAVIERKLRKYFGEADAIVRKLEKDKYFIVFQKKYLNKLIEDKFSILESIKNTKLGNDLEITLSIGMGVDGETYFKNAEYARSALSLSLGRGGSQVVIKDGKEVSIYGVKGKEIAKNARVKARVKAQALRELMSSRERVLVMGHKLSDSDCLGAAIGIAVAARDVGKPVNIVINTASRVLKPFMEMFLGDDNYPEDLFINSEHAIDLANKNTLIVVVDTNRPAITECEELLTKSGGIVVFDHHRQGKDVIQNTILSYIEPFASSTCEMVAEILQYFSENIRLTAKEADALYAGMLVDTNNFMTKTGVRTFEAAAYLKRNGAEVTNVRKLLREDVNAYKARAEVVRNAIVYKDAFAISVCNTSELESPTVIGAQASNELLNIVGIKASFVLTEYLGKVYVSSRSIDEIDVQIIMERLGGGGHLNIAGAQVEDKTIEELIENIKEIIDSMIEEGLIK